MKRHSLQAKKSRGAFLRTLPDKPRGGRFENFLLKFLPFLEKPGEQSCDHSPENQGGEDLKTQIQLYFKELPLTF